MKNLINYHFGERVPRTGVPIAHIETKALSSIDAINIVDTAGLIGENSFSKQDSLVIINNSNQDHFIKRRGFLITDKFSINGNPLYFKHKLGKNIFEDQDSKVSLSLIDENGKNVDSSLYLYDCGKKAVYHSLSFENSKYYSVLYPRANENNQVVESNYSEILTSSSALEEAKADDIYNCGIDPDSDSYTVTEMDGLPHSFRLRLPRPSKYILKYTKEGVLDLKVPNASQEKPWYIEIHNATVLSKNINNDIFLKYSITEFDQQTFYPFAPIKLKTNISAKKISTSLIDLQYKNIFITNKTPLDIMIYDINNILIFAATTDKNKENVKIKGIYWDTSGIASVDKNSGIVKIYKDIKLGQKIFANLFYEEDSYTYTGWNFNPMFNSDAVNKKVIMLLKPNATDCFSSLSHCVVGEESIIESSSDEDISGWIDGIKKIDDLMADWVYSSNSDSSNINNYMMLGIVSVTTPISSEDSLIVDSRRRGGGIIKDLEDQAIALMPTAQNNWDIGNYDGPQEPMHGGILIYLPSRLLQFYTEAQLRELASRYSAAGTYIVIRYY